MKKQYAALMLLLVALAGCGKRKKTKLQTNKETFTEVDIPVSADSNIRSFFDEDLGEFALADDAPQQPQTQAQADDFSWVEQTASQQQFKVVYFDFDNYEIRADQEENLKHDIDVIKQSLAQGNNAQATIVIDGHACHSAGSHLYNLALSEKRAKVLAERLIEEGIPSECIKIVGRGMEMPAIVDGKVIDGDRTQQWANRRDEVRIIYS